MMEHSNPPDLLPIKNIDTTPEKKKGPFSGGFNLPNMLMGILSGGNVMKQVAAIISNAFDKFAGKMKNEDCLVAVPNKDKTKLRIMRGTFELVDANTITIHLD